MKIFNLFPISPRDLTCNSVLAIELKSAQCICAGKKVKSKKIVQQSRKIKGDISTPPGGGAEK